MDNKLTVFSDPTIVQSARLKVDLDRFNVTYPAHASAATIRSIYKEKLSIHYNDEAALAHMLLGQQPPAPTELSPLARKGVKRTEDKKSKEDEAAIAAATTREEEEDEKVKPERKRGRPSAAADKKEHKERR